LSNRRTEKTTSQLSGRLSLPRRAGAQPRCRRSLAASATGLLRRGCFARPPICWCWTSRPMTLIIGPPWNCWSSCAGYSGTVLIVSARPHFLDKRRHQVHRVRGDGKLTEIVGRLCQTGRLKAQQARAGSAIRRRQGPRRRTASPKPAAKPSPALQGGARGWRLCLCKIPCHWNRAGGACGQAGRSLTVSMPAARMRRRCIARSDAIEAELLDAFLARWESLGGEQAG